MLNQTDLNILTSRGISEADLLNQLSQIRNGFPYLRLAGSATVGKGIERLTPQQEAEAIDRWNEFLAEGGTVTKFVPASGAASRMFKALYSFLNSENEVPEPGSDVSKLIDNLENLPFLDSLDSVLQKGFGKNAITLRSDGRYKDIIQAILDPEGMNYGNLPKGLLIFHRYPDNKRVRRAFEEQMAEGAQTAASNGKVNLHFTVSSNHRKLFEEMIDASKPEMEASYGVKYNISLSEQKPSTDTVAANPDFTPFRDDKGNIVFRPGGHGSLIENLGDIDSEVVFIKNIDNVVPENARQDTIRYKKILGGILMLTHDSIERYLKELKAGNVSRNRLLEILTFVENILKTRREGIENLTDKELKEYLIAKLDRPLRVCGMVRNEGEPGGGPYLAYNQDGSYSPQILESTQIDTTNSESAAMMSHATHFNPVDLVCYLRDANGDAYDLKKYIDNNTGFISHKSSNGRDLLALERPGLWNGAMSDWSTIFVEVPATTFNPVKTVNDLLRPIHQADK